MQKTQTSAQGSMGNPGQKLAATAGPSHYYPKNAGRDALNSEHSGSRWTVMAAESRADLGLAQLRSRMVEYFEDVIKRPALECFVPSLGVANE